MFNLEKKEPNYSNCLVCGSKCFTKGVERPFQEINSDTCLHPLQGKQLKIFCSVIKIVAPRGKRDRILLTH